MAWKTIEKAEYSFTATTKHAHELEARVKWDGCVDLNRIYNSGSKSEDRVCIHICDLGDFIEELQQLQILALNYFGSEDWPG